MFEDIEKVFYDGKWLVINPESVWPCFKDSEILPIVKRIGIIELHSKIYTALNGNGDILMFPDFISLFIFAGHNDFIRPWYPHSVAFFFEIISLANQVVSKRAWHWCRQVRVVLVGDWLYGVDVNRAHTCVKCGAEMELNVFYEERVREDRFVVVCTWQTEELYVHYFTLFIEESWIPLWLLSLVPIEIIEIFYGSVRL